MRTNLKWDEITTKTMRRMTAMSRRNETAQDTPVRKPAKNNINVSHIVSYTSMYSTTTPADSASQSADQATASTYSSPSSS
jgi:hypothetical protein